MNEPEWCMDVIEICKLMPDRNDRLASLETVPEWVGRIDSELERRNFPVRIRERELVSPRKAGQLIGQTYAYYGWILECLRHENSALSVRLRRERKENLAEDYDDQMEASMRTFIDSDMMRAGLRFRMALQQVFFVVASRPFPEAAEFFDGFSEAVAKRSKDDSIWDESYSTTAALFVIRRDYGFVQSFKNVSDLHIYLQHKLGRNAAGDLDRTRSLAKRLKLKLARRGRPSKKWVKVPR